MKFLSLTVLIGCLLQGCSFHSTPSNQRATVQTPNDPPCASGVVVVQEQPDAPAGLTVEEARCRGSRLHARLKLTNSSDKVITAYEVADTGTYEYKKKVESSQSQTGLTLRPGESKEIKSSGGFRDDLSYGKPTGSIQKSIFRVTRIEFAMARFGRNRRTQPHANKLGNPLTSTMTA